MSHAAPEQRTKRPNAAATFFDSFFDVPATPGLKEANEGNLATPAEIGTEAGRFLLGYAQRVYDEAHAIRNALESRRLEMLKFTAIIVAGYAALRNIASAGAPGYVDGVGLGVVAIGAAILLLSGLSRHVVIQPNGTSYRRSVHRLANWHKCENAAPYCADSVMDAAAGGLIAAAESARADAGARSNHLNAGTLLIFLGAALLLIGTLWRA